MEFSFSRNKSRNKISMEKVMSDLDRFVFKFCRILEENKIKYVIVSGYVAIVFGRSRNTEDIDVLVEKIDFEKFEKLWDILMKKYDCINASSAKTAYFEYLNKKTAVRFSEKGRFIPNFEFKFTKTDIDEFTLDNAIELEVDKDKILISPIELQIAYKLQLGSDKDIDDAIFLFELFKSNLDNEELKKWFEYLKIAPELIKQLKGKIWE